MLSRRGWSLIGAAAGLYVGARILGLVQLAVLGIGAGVLVATAYTWVRWHSPLLTAERDLKERLQVGVDGRVDIAVRGRTAPNDNARGRRFVRPRTAGRTLPARAAGPVR